MVPTEESRASEESSVELAISAWAISYGGSARPSRMLNNFAHDMCTGTWVACLLVLWVVGSRVAGAPESARQALTDSQHAVFGLLVLALVGLAATGGLRLMYWRRDTPAAQLSAKRSVLAVKHVAFFLVYGVGSALAGWLVFR